MLRSRCCCGSAARWAPCCVRWIARLPAGLPVGPWAQQFQRLIKAPSRSRLGAAVRQDQLYSCRSGCRRVAVRPAGRPAPADGRICIAGSGGRAERRRPAAMAAVKGGWFAQTLPQRWPPGVGSAHCGQRAQSSCGRPVRQSLHMAALPDGAHRARTIAADRVAQP